MRIFVDTSFYIALLRQDDTQHKKATAILDKLDHTDAILYTSHFVIDETVTVLSMRVSKKEANKFLDTVLQKDFPMILDMDSALRKTSHDFFRSLKNKNISMIDCHSVILMNHKNIEYCLTFDDHFKKMGFKVWG
ncbi:MAG: PilT domain-containing protein [Parcubacteria group bacterium Gr01-1014_18]|nr:MAG: PilT domain-containing protein [Parcubacteria group bacterium Greene0416_36]TSC80712.1 MAG: PilT domain-containing protein [Parcubacteria group bacterium Gr01-1014_18]TSC98677.1 MAG: PilT domain-containing protein [Parcubacteria group bacterium Greene1014_20]TSD07163.1 MAG: PilT domain-containing protein [Parcubacteria group bacterium Greene0714_2]